MILVIRCMLEGYEGGWVCGGRMTSRCAVGIIGQSNVLGKF